MKSLILTIAMLSGWAATAEQNTQTFTMQYEVFYAKAVCFAPPCYDYGGYRCDGVDFEIFFDDATYHRTKELPDNVKYDFRGYCSETSTRQPEPSISIPYVEENMLKLKAEDVKNGTNQANSILEQKGVMVPVIIYNRVDREVKSFVNDTLGKAVEGAE
ncbi:MAG: hypothetical protein HRT45_01585 [Bdellovibrionales bacterium]|nr:hypothetical protein [Bdellovibrionales bacterium]